MLFNFLVSPSFFPMLVLPFYERIFLEKVNLEYRLWQLWAQNLYLPTTLPFEDVYQADTWDLCVKRDDHITNREITPVFLVLSSLSSLQDKGVQ